MTALLLVAVVLSGLNAGLYVAFSIAVMPGLRRTSDDSFAAAMRGINVAIINPVFLVVFLGPLLTSGAALVWAALGDGPPRVVVAAAVGVVLHVLTIVATAAVNVPLNDALEDGADDDAAAARQAFERRWVRSNHLRSIAATCALAALAVALAGPA